MASPDLSNVWKQFIETVKKITPAKRAGLYSLVLVGLVALLYLIYSIAFLGRVYPRVFVGGQKYSGLSEQQVKDKLTALNTASQAAPLKLTYQDKTSTVSAKDAGWAIDVNQTAAQIFGVGRGSSAWQSFLEQLGAPFAKQSIEPVVAYDQNFLADGVAAVAATVDQPAVDATASYQDDKLIITPEKGGSRIDQAIVMQAVLAKWAAGDTSPIALSTNPEAPKILVGNQDQLKAAADKLAQTKIILSWPGSTKTLSKKDLHKLIAFSAGSDQTLQANFSLDATKSYLQDLAVNGINQPAKDPTLGIQDGKLTVLAASAKGRIVDIDASAPQLLTALQANSGATVTLTFKDDLPIITENNLDSLGIKELIGRGQTSFAGSPTNRKANIANGVHLLQSALVKPGDEFSTVKTLGAVDGTTGFLPELVIKDNATTPEFGGGLCQVSTTLFRAVMNAGLKVTERQNHSYRVGYYEPPIGLDATIYLPKPDFKFLNDTGHYVLLQGRVEGNSVIFELWGTSDGRTSQISDPQILSTTPVTPPIYTDTDTLPKGTIKQVEKAHDGATVVAYYTVTRNGQVINKQTFRSVYKIWPAKFLRGTHEDPVPPPTT